MALVIKELYFSTELCILNQENANFFNLFCTLWGRGPQPLKLNLQFFLVSYNSALRIKIYMAHPAPSLKFNN